MLAGLRELAKLVNWGDRDYQKHIKVGENFVEFRFLAGWNGYKPRDAEKTSTLRIEYFEEAGEAKIRILGRFSGSDNMLSKPSEFLVGAHEVSYIDHGGRASSEETGKVTVQISHALRSIRVPLRFDTDVNSYFQLVFDEKVMKQVAQRQGLFFYSPYGFQLA